MEIVRATGWTWHVWYRCEGEEIDVMLADALTAERALEEARFSLSAGGEAYTILGLFRAGAKAALA